MSGELFRIWRGIELTGKFRGWFVLTRKISVYKNQNLGRKLGFLKIVIQNFLNLTPSRTYRSLSSVPLLGTFPCYAH